MKTQVSSSTSVRSRAAGTAVPLLLLALGAGPAAADAPPRLDERAAAALGMRPGERISPERLQTLYRESLGLWAAGQVDAAAERLMAAEAGMVVEGDIETRKLLLKAQEQVIRELAANNLEVLVPMAMLHHEIYRRHLEQGTERHALLTVHARNMARDLALLYEKHGGTEQARTTSARVLTSLGGYLLDSSQQLLAGQLFTLASGFDPGSLGAHLGLATIYEKNGRYDAAVGSLRNAVAVDPMRVEAWLRLGVNLARLGRTDEARRALEPLVKIATWVGAVAVQELAGMQIKDEQWPAAEALLRAGIERMPNEGVLYLQLCAVLDRQGRRGEAQEMMSRFLAIPGEERGTSRLRYNRDPAEVWAEVRKRLDESSRTSLPMLAQALGLPPAAPRTGEASR